jgi:hypothetical protein
MVWRYEMPTTIMSATNPSASGSSKARAPLPANTSTVIIASGP